jgi:transaldolase/glucose-6-phosphate isomerase
MKENPLMKVAQLGQSIWLDFIRRGMIESGELQHMIEADGLKGVTSNPSIFDKAISGSHDYDQAIQTLALEGADVSQIYEALTIEDIRRAADLFRPIYDKTGGTDGFVSLEVSPHLARDMQDTVLEARRLWKNLDRPNVMIKVPGTRECLTAIRELIREGINVNVNLLFSLDRYRQVAKAYITGLEDRREAGIPLDTVSSVASFFLSRIDVLVDPMLEEWMKESGEQAAIAKELPGQIAIASAKVAYQIWEEVFVSSEFKALAELGARPQRLLWASTSTKTPNYSDVKYVEELIGPDTITTLPISTLNAYRDHGDPKPRLVQDINLAFSSLAHLEKTGIELNKVTDQLEKEGIDKFIRPYDQLMNTLERKRQAVLSDPLDRLTVNLGSMQPDLRKQMDRLQRQDFQRRLWLKDAALWSDDPDRQHQIKNALGWLHVIEQMEHRLVELKAFATEVIEAGFRHVLHIGMGGSSLAPYVFQHIFPTNSEGLPLTVLDSTDPATILKIQQTIPLQDTLVVIASKSGKTAETLSLGDYFFHLISNVKGSSAVDNFVVITDPGTQLAELAIDKGYRRVFLNFPDIGGRYSALSFFGLVPAVLHGVDVEEILQRALRMQHACDASLPLAESPGGVLGAAIGEAAAQGRDKVTFIADPRIDSFPMWLEQLLAESTGKEGTGLIPVVGEPLGTPQDYFKDRLFVVIQLRDRPLVDDDRVKALREAGHPTVAITLDDLFDLGQEFYRWEIATAVAGSILNINPFDQPNVQESKDNTNRLLTELEIDGALPTEEPMFVSDGLTIYAQEEKDSLDQVLRDLFDHKESDSYLAIMAYLEEQPSTEQLLQTIRGIIRDRLSIATTVGYGPRFLHSTGQMHKGGPACGLFLQLTADDEVDLEIPDAEYTFGMMKHAQALGDLQSLRRRGLPLLHIHLNGNVSTSLTTLEEHIKEIL